MTYVKAQWAQEGFYIEAKGHSGFDRAGKDIVCAAISTLIFTAVIMTEKMHSAGQLRQSSADIREGYVKITACAIEGKREKLQGIFESVTAGLQLLEESFPENIKIKIEEGEKNAERKDKKQ